MIPGADKSVRVIGFDDTPFQRGDDKVNVAGIVCSNTRFEGMLWGSATPDGFDATEALTSMLRPSKFHSQLHAVLLDGIAVGGLNIIDLPRLAENLALPCVAVMRKQPDIGGMKRAIGNLPDAARRLELLDRAGEIHSAAPFVFQVAGIEATAATSLLQRVTDKGHVPEALRLAHLIGSAVKTGTSGRRA